VTLPESLREPIVSITRLPDSTRVPLASGNSFQPGRPFASGATVHVSIPFASGNSFEHSCNSNVHLGPSRLNPLRIGEVFPTCWV